MRLKVFVLVLQVTLVHAWANANVLVSMLVLLFNMSYTFFLFFWTQKWILSSPLHTRAVAQVLQAFRHRATHRRATHLKATPRRTTHLKVTHLKDTPQDKWGLELRTPGQDSLLCRGILDNRNLAGRAGPLLARFMERLLRTQVRRRNLWAAFAYFRKN